MTFVKADRVQERSITVGSGDIVLGGAYEATYRTFLSQRPGADASYTCQTLTINEDANNEWEINEAVYTVATNSLQRVVTLSSSDNDGPVTFSSGTKRVAMLPPASAMVVEDNLGNVEIEGELTLGVPLSIGNGGTGATNAAAARFNLGITTSGVGSASDLAALSGGDLTGSVIVDGYANPADGGGGIYTYDATSNADPIQGAIIRPDSIAPGNPGRWLLLYDREVNLCQFGAIPDGATYVDATSAFEAAFALAETFAQGAGASARLGAMVLHIPSGRFEIDPILTDVSAIRMVGVDEFTPRITAKTAAQPYLFYFNSTSPAIEIEHLEIIGWRSSTPIASWPDYGIIIEDGTNSIHECQLDRCHTPLWLRKGNFNRIWKNRFTFFDTYGIALGGINRDATVLVGQSWFDNVVTFETTDAHGLIEGAPFTISGSSPVGYNGDFVAIAGTTTGPSGTIITAALTSDPGLSNTLGQVDATTGISETRITEVDLYSGAASPVDYQGVAIGYLSGCEATVLENVFGGGSVVIGHEIVDNLGLGDDHGAGFVTLRGCTMGTCGTAGVWIKNGGSSFAADNCNFSAVGTDADGVIVDAPGAAPRFYNCDWHNCQRDGIRATDFYSITVLGGTFRDIGVRGGTNGIGIHMVEGSGKLFVYGAIFDNDLTVDNTSHMDYAVRLATAYTGTVYLASCKALAMAVTPWSNASTTGILNTYDNSDLVIVPQSARAQDINQLITDYDNIVFLYPVSVSGTITVPPEKTLISMVSGEPVVISTADVIFEVGGGGDEFVVHGPAFQGEWWVDGVDRTQLRVGFSILPETYKLEFDSLQLTGLGTGMKGTRGNIRGVFIDRLFMYDIRDYGIRFYSDTRSLEIDTICIGPMLSNTKDSGAECVWFDIGPRVGSGGKNSFNIGPGIAYRGKNTIHTWGVLELTAQSWAPTGGGQVTFTTEYKHGLAVGDSFYIGDSAPSGYNNLPVTNSAQSWLAGTVSFTMSTATAIKAGDVFTVSGALPTGYNGTYTAATVVGNVVTAALVSDPGASTRNGTLTPPALIALAGSTGKTLIASVVSDPGASTTLGYYTVSNDVTYSGNVIFNAPRKMRVDKLSSRGTVDDGFNLQAGADFEFASVTIDDPGTSNFNIPLTAQSWITGGGDLTAQSWGANVVTYTTTSAHGLSPGDTFEIVGSSPSGYNGVWTAIAGTAGSTLTATLLVDPTASTVLGVSRGRNSFTTATVHGLNIGDYFVVNRSSPDGYNGTYQALTVPSTTTVTGFRTFDPGASTTLGYLDVPLNVNACGYRFGPRFHGTYRIRGGMLHECYGNGVRHDAIYCMPSTIDGLLVWNSSWGSPGVNSGLYFAPGTNNVTMLSVTSGTGDHWRHASKGFEFSGAPTAGDTITLNGTPLTYRATASLPLEITIAGTAAGNAQATMDAILASNEPNLLALTPSVSGSTLTVTHYPGASGNLFTVATTSGVITITPAGTRLSGGTGTQVQKYGWEGIVDGQRQCRVINCNGNNNTLGAYPITTYGQPIIDRITTAGTTTYYGYPGATRYEVTCWGGGGGGGGGRRGAAGSARSGGLGGCGSLPTTRNLTPSQITFPVTVTIGAAGTAGTAAAGDNADGGDGGAGGDTTFAALLRALGGYGGKGGGAVAINGLSGGGTGVSLAGRAFPGTSSVTAAVGVTASGANSSSASGGGPGGVGGSISTGNADLAGCQADFACYADPALSAPAGPAGVGAGGANGSNSALLNFAGYGGGGGGGNAAGAGGAGGTGGRGSGGGGGGASVNGSASGAGGIGGTGQCSIKAYFD